MNCFAARSITNGQFNEMKLIFSGLYSGSLFAREFILKSLRYCTTTSHCTLLAFFWDIHLLDLIGPSPLSNMYICTTERNINRRFQIFYILHPASDMSYLFIFSSVSFQKSSRTEHRFSWCLTTLLYRLSKSESFSKSPNSFRAQRLYGKLILAFLSGYNYILVNVQILRHSLICYHIIIIKC